MYGGDYGNDDDDDDHDVDDNGGGGEGDDSAVAKFCLVGRRLMKADESLGDT